MSRCIQTDRFLSAAVSQGASPRGLTVQDPDKWEASQNEQVNFKTKMFNQIGGKNMRVSQMKSRATVQHTLGTILSGNNQVLIEYYQGSRQMPITMVLNN